MVSSTKGARITGEERQQLMLSYVRRYQAGESIRSLATDTGRSYGFVQGLLKEAGVPLRARGGATRGAEAEAERRERQVRVEAVRAAERSDDAAAPASTPADPQHREAAVPSQPEGQDRPDGSDGAAAQTAPVEHSEHSGPHADQTETETERRDLYRAPTSPADLGLPTPPLGVLVPKKDKGKKKAKKIAAKKAEQAGMPQHLHDLVKAKDAAARERSDQDGSAKDKAGKDKAGKNKAGKDGKGKKAKKAKDKAGKDKKPKK